MNWYLAKIVFHILSGDGIHTPQFDEQLRLIAAPDKKEAFRKAREIGHNEEDSFLNHAFEKVSWNFIGVCELIELKEIKDGMEVFSCIHEKEHAELYIQWVKQQTSAIENQTEKANAPC